jgi:mRNA-degrading endonuclease YafQ of YafQ-DinJ toxin-antitoxin module
MTNSVRWAIVETAGYARALRKFLRKHPDLRQAHAQIITLLHENPFHPSLKLHGLHGQHAGIQAVSITYSYQMTFTIAIVEREIVLLDIGSHDDIYR